MRKDKLWNELEVLFGVCSIHIHNDLAKKRGAMEPIAESFWQMILELGVTFVGGDF